MKREPEVTRSIFYAAVNKTRLGDRAVAIAERVIMDGCPIIEAAEEAGVSRQMAGKSVRRVRQAILEVQGHPESWEVVTVCVPKKTAKKIRDIAASARHTGAA